MTGLKLDAPNCRWMRGKRKAQDSANPFGASESAQFPAAGAGGIGQEWDVDARLREGWLTLIFNSETIGAARIASVAISRAPAPACRHAPARKFFIRMQLCGPQQLCLPPVHVGQPRFQDRKGCVQVIGKEAARVELFCREVFERRLARPADCAASNPLRTAAVTCRLAAILSPFFRSVS